MTSTSSITIYIYIIKVILNVSDRKVHVSSRLHSRSHPRQSQKLASDWSIFTTNQMLRLGISSWITDYIDIHIPRYADVYVYTCLRYVYICTHVYTHSPCSVLSSQTLRLCLIQSYYRLIERNASLIF